MNITKNILATLAYFDIFRYPLTPIEIYSFLREKTEYETFLEELEYLISIQIVYKLDEFYSLNKDYALVTRRRKGNRNAKKLLETASRVANFLNYFPFVKGIAVSGSLSKNFADEKADIDFFIITRKNRLWIARSLMHCFKKLTYLAKRQNYFCMNYFIDELGMTIEEKNIFTATEISTLIPIKGLETFRNFYQHNTWTREYLPNHSMKVSYLNETKTPLIKRCLEILFGLSVFNKIERILMKITKSRWDRKSFEGRVNEKGILLGLKISRHYSKPNPHNFQFKLIDLYENKIADLIPLLKNKAQL